MQKKGVITYLSLAIISSAISNYSDGKKALKSYADYRGGDTKHEYIRDRIYILPNMFYGLFWPFSIVKDIIPHLIIKILDDDKPFR